MISLQPYRFVPRPITDRVFWTNLESLPYVGKLVKRLDERAQAQPARPVLPLASDYLAARRYNDRTRVDNFWMEQRGDLMSLCVRRLRLGIDPNDPDDRLLDTFWAHLNLPTWVVSAHLPGNDLPASGSAQLDLAACEMAANFVETREVLKPWMDSVSNTLADSVIREVDRRVLEPFVASSKGYWADLSSDHVNNWIGVCAGTILAACESLAAQGHPRPEARAKSIACLRRFFDRAFTPAGECDEGLMYWLYGVGFAAIGLMRLDPSELRASFDIDRIRQVASYPLSVHLYGDTFFSGNDAGLRASPDLTSVPWLAAALDLPGLAQWAMSAEIGLTRYNVTTVSRIFDSATRLPAPDKNDAARAIVYPPVRYVTDQQVAIFQTPTTKGPLLATLTGGTNAERHNHNDLGHVNVALNEKMLFPDMGAPQYTADFFGPKRYTYLSASSRGHSCPLVNGQEQVDGSKAAAKVVSFAPDAPEPSFTVDLSAGYPPEAMLKSWTRTLTSTRGHTMVLDDAFTTQPGGEIVHVLYSAEPPVPDGQGVTVGGLAVSFDPAPVGLIVVPIDATAHNLRDYKGVSLWRIEAAYRSGSDGRLKLRTTFAS